MCNLEKDELYQEDQEWYAHGGVDVWDYRLDKSGHVIEIYIKPHEGHCQLAFFPKEFCEFKSLKILELQFYELESIPEAITNLKCLKKLDIDNLVTPVYDVNVFKLTDYIGAKQTNKAIDMLDKLAESGNSTFQIFSMIVRQFRIFLQIEEMQTKPASEIASALKLHPFVVQNSIKQLRSFSKTELLKAYQDLLEIDRKLKTGEVKISANNENMFMLELEKFILKLAN